MTAAAPETAPDRRRWLGLVVISIAVALIIVDSTKMTPFLVSEANRLVAACEAELRTFARDEGHGPDW